MFRYVRHSRLVLLAVLFALSNAVHAQPVQDKPLEALVDERDELETVFSKCVEENNLPEAMTAAEQLATIERELLRVPNEMLGADKEQLAPVGKRLVATLDWIAERQTKLEEFAAASQSRQEIVLVTTRAFGPQHWEVTDAQLALADVKRLAAMTPKERERLPEFEQLNNRGVRFLNQGKFKEGVPLIEKAAEIIKEVLGPTHAHYATSLNNLAALYYFMGDHVRAESLYHQALEVRKEVLGKQHPHYAQSLNNLAMLYESMGDYARAEPLLQQALGIRKEVWGEKHPDYAASLNNLAALYDSMGDFGRAAPLYRRALEIQKAVLGETHPDYAASLNNLATLYKWMGDYASAEPLNRQALEIWKKVFGEKHPLYATGLNNLAALYENMGDHARAAPLYQQALAIWKEVLGEKHPSFATSLNNLALLYKSMGDFARAAPLYRQALGIRKEVLGEKHPDYAASLNHLAILYASMGDYARAAPLLEQAREIRKGVLGEQHPSYAESLNNLASLYKFMDDDARAAPLYRQALEIARSNLDLCSNVQSERQQLVMSKSLRHYLDGYLSVTDRLKRPSGDAYRYVLVWKGAVLARQRWIRLGQSHSDPETARAIEELQSTASRLATLVFAVPDPKKRDVWRRQIEELTERKEQLERDLALRSSEVRQEQARAQLTPDQLQQALPNNVVLVDFLEYARSTPPEGKKGKSNAERCLVAFVVRAQRPIVRVELGPVAPIAEAVQRWRRDFGVPADDGEPDAPGKQLRTLVWQPLQLHIEGAEIVLVSPDGVLNRLPLAALPGSEPQSYLLEETALAVVPVPQLLPELLEERSDAPAGDTPPNLLLVGDVDFDFQLGVEPDQLAVSSRPWSRRRDGKLQTWDPLPGTRAEILAIQDSFTRAKPDAVPMVLREGAASESAVRQAMPSYEYLHFATHGFFAPSTIKSALMPGRADRDSASASFDIQVSGFHPGLLSGIVLAGANRPATDGDDGVLTAMEVAQLDLRQAELVVLSACETGLGELASGEGVLGLQRAFQVAGASSVVTSLWNVEDEATRQLMERFYENYWVRRLGMLDSLREAQLWRLQEGGRRGAVRLDSDATHDQSTRTPPYYWAGFVLSGDWR